jgi:hypothetical protein
MERENHLENGNRVMQTTGLESDKRGSKAPFSLVMSNSQLVVQFLKFPSLNIPFSKTGGGS